ncbi:MAG: pilus (MSHA type) biogenesis protein MshL [Gammaproteobacteria bacterium]|nr:pilus (MSHA type) biogenesis protein MshL [Gammaproteobacteria bacterium]MBU1415839.1 pilus (MSHA type) biogenesis protein MshL [Gammaproteobacteria bacterium]
MKPHSIFAPLLALTISACSTAPIAPPSAGHIDASTVSAPTPENIPAPVQNTVTPPVPKPAAKVETYSVVVNNVRVHDLLFALARDAKVNVDVHPGIDGVVTLNAIDQTLPQLLERIAKQVDMRWEMDGPNLVVMPDSPYLRTYRVDYVNMSRETEGSVTVTTQVAATGVGASGTGASGGSSGGAGGNNSLTRIKNEGKHHFWETLEKNVKDILRETDKILPEGSSETTIERSDQQATFIAGENATTGGSGKTSRSGTNEGATQQSGTTVVKRTTFREAASVIVNPESGIVVVRATSRQHERIQEFLSQVLASARRQVLIEATIAEVTLSDNYQQGIDWKVAPVGSKGFTISQLASTVAGTALPKEIVNLAYNNTASRLGSITAAVKLLDEFGTVRVLSSPKLSVLNNQTAVLKVVDNLVYFTIKADTTSNANTSTTTYTTNLNSVPVGLVMNVTPQISENDTVLLNIRPSISRKFGEVIDPNPDLQRLGVENKIPVIRTREMESMIRVENGNIAVMGGLMEDGQEYADTAIPAISRIPIIGNFFQNKNDTRRKTELVVFLRPVVIKNASIEGDYASFRNQLPNKHFFDGALGPDNRLGGNGGSW